MPARIRSFVLALASLLPAASVAQQTPPTASSAALTPPVAAVRPHRFDEHGNVRIDQYYWLRDRDNPEVIKYLEDENAYTKAVMAHTEALQDRLFEELKGRVRQNDQSVPYRQGGYFYYTRVVEGKTYPIYARKRGSLDAPEEILIDGNALGQGKPFFQVMGWQISSGEDLLAVAVDTIGRRIASLRIKNLRTDELLPEVMEHVTGNMAWAEDNRTLFYTKHDSVTLRWNRIYRHVVGTPASADQLVYEEKDDTYEAFVFKTKSRAYVIIGSQQTLASEYRFVPAAHPSQPFQVLEPRRRGHEYDVDHLGNYFYLRTNDGAQNFRLMRTPVNSTARANWQEVIPNRADVFLQNFEIFKDYLVLSERRNGLTELRVRPWNGSAEHNLDFGEPAYVAYISTNAELDTTVLRFGYQSLTTPARAGARVPGSFVYRKGIARPAPLLLYGYGSYGSSTDPTFSADRLSLLDRGFVYAIAHIRGGQEMGRAWYDDGKLLHKKNTFTDFIDVADDLVRRGYTSADRLFARGGSAGGLLMGAVINMRPELFKGVIAGVPYVDVITTMMDASIPLTTGAYDEWGNPNDSTYYRYMLSYSPYDNVERKAYPNLLITAGLHDSQVQYFEPAKWTARLRAMKTDANRLILRTNMEAGHGGASGRYKRWRDVAFEYAFLLDLAGLAHAPPAPARP